MKRMGMLGVVLLLLLSFNAAAQVRWPAVLTLATAGQGSTSHVAATVTADALSKNTPIRRVVVEPYGAASRWVRPMNAGEVDIAFHASFRATADAYYGEGDFARDGPQKVMNLMVGYVNPWGVVTTRRDIDSFDDLRGKRLLVFTVNRDHVTIVKGLMAIYGMKEGDIEIVPTQNIQAAVQLLMDGKAEALLFGLVPALEEVKRARGLWGVPVPAEVGRRIIEQYEPTRTLITVKAGTTVLAPENNLPFFGLPAGAAVREDLDEELVYQIVKVIYEKAGESLRSAHRDFVNWGPELATAIMPQPLHPGIVRYLEEKGLWNHQLEARQKELIARRRR